MRLEQFVYGLFNGRGYRLIKSSGVDKVLSEESVQRLIKFAETRKSETTIPMHFPTENMLTLTHVVPVKDEYGRQGIWCHTIIAPVKEFVWQLNPFLQDYPDKPPKSLEPIELK